MIIEEEKKRIDSYVKSILHITKVKGSHRYWPRYALV